MFKATTITAILAFCSISSAAPAAVHERSTTNMPGTATGTGAGFSTFPAPTPSAILSYTQSVQTADISDTDTTVTALAEATTADGPPATPTGLSKTQQMLLSDSRADAINDVLPEDGDLLFDFNTERKDGPGEGGEIVLANRKTFPALANTGISMAVGFLKPCGFNTPHIHNRATEFLVVTSGEVMSEMVVENGVNGDDDKPRNIMNKLTALQAMPFYQGSLHSQFNPTCNDVTFVAALSSDDPGTNTMAQAFSSLGDDTLRAVVGNQIEGQDIENFRSLLSVSVAQGVEQCLETCGIPKRK